MNTISPTDFRSLFESSEEFAAIDTREAGVFGRAHLLVASNLPLSRLDLLIHAAVPRLATTIIICETDNARQSEEVLINLGYKDVRVLAGGIAGWALEGGKLFSGTHVIGKAFGEFIEKSRRTPSIDARRLRQLLSSATPPLLLDTRTTEEHQSFCIPSAISCPNGELIYRALSLAADKKQAVVTHCAGRTRSIIGAQTLIDAGMPNPIFSLKNGTPAWVFEEYELEHGANRLAPLPNSKSIRHAQAVVDSLARRHRIYSTDIATVSTWLNDTLRTTYLLDIRSSEEHVQSYFPNARQVPGGQLVQNVDKYLITRNARVVLLDNDGIRGKATAAWLSQLGWRDVGVVTIDVDNLSSGCRPKTYEQSDLTCSNAIENIHKKKVRLVDCRASTDYRAAHPKDAVFLTRANLINDSAYLDVDTPVIIFGSDNAYVHKMVADLRILNFNVQSLVATLEDWQRAGGLLESGTEMLYSTPDDVFLPDELAGGYREAKDFHKNILNREARAYLDWEIGLAHQLDNDPGAPYVN